MTPIKECLINGKTDLVPKDGSDYVDERLELFNIQYFTGDGSTLTFTLNATESLLFFSTIYGISLISFELNNSGKIIYPSRLNCVSCSDVSSIVFLPFILVTQNIIGRLYSLKIILFQAHPYDIGIHFHLQLSKIFFSLSA